MTAPQLKRYAHSYEDEGTDCGSGFCHYGVYLHHGLRKQSVVVFESK